MPWQNSPADRQRSNNTYDAAWRKARLAALKRDGNRCTRCGTNRTRLEVDHINPVSATGIPDHSLTNLRTLCVTCHDKITAQQGNAWRHRAVQPPSDPQPRPATDW